jgi:hypothetical protein
MAKWALVAPKRTAVASSLAYILLVVLCPKREWIEVDAIPDSENS